MRAERVLVVGGGLAGLSVGIALTHVGSQVKVVEKAEQWADVGAGMYLPGNAHRAMEALGIASVVRDRELPDQASGLQGSHRADLVRGRPPRGLG